MNQPPSATPQTEHSPLLVKAICTAAQQLERMPGSPEVRALKIVVQRMGESLERVPTASSEERELMMKKVMAIHLTIARLTPRSK